MTSRNKSQGRYAGKFRGQHVRTSNTLAAIAKPIPNGVMYLVPKLPQSMTAWRVWNIRKVIRK